MASNPDNDRESADAEKVDAAMKALAANDHRLAETKLLAVIAKTPRDYSNTVETADEIALHELQYIEHLKEGGAAAMSGPVQSSGSDLSICGVCGQRFEEGVVVSLRDNPVGICSKCHTKLTKK